MIFFCRCRCKYFVSLLIMYAMLRFFEFGSLQAGAIISEHAELNINQAIIDAELQDLTIPNVLEHRIHTLNHYGFMFTKLDPLVNRFLQIVERNPQNVFFELGGAYGIVAQKALEIGAKNYYLNDCDERHLKAFARHLNETGKSHLFPSLHLVPGRCPEEVVLIENSCDGIFVDKVLHFFTPETIDNFVEWLKSGLKPGGKVYIFTVSPFNKEFDDFLSTYKDNKLHDIKFPGYCSDFSKLKLAQNYDILACPRSILLIELDTLKNLFIKHGFEIEETFELSGDRTDWCPGTDWVGIIAIKPTKK